MYGESKLEGELSVQEKNSEAIIARVAWLYGEGRDNFVKWVSWLAKKGREIPAITDEMGNYTYSRDVADSLFSFLKKDPDASGIFHMVGDDVGAPIDIARLVVKLYDSKSEVKEILSGDLERVAKRPLKTNLVNTKLPKLPGFRESVPKFLKV